MKKEIFAMLTFFLIYAYTPLTAQEIKKPVLKLSEQIFLGMDRIWESAMEDLNGDGFIDLVLTDLGSRTKIFFNNGKGVFKESEQNLNIGTHGIAIGDIDGDGDMDLLFAVLGKNMPSAIYLNDGKGKFVRSNLNLSIESSEIVKLIDIDCDGDLDAYFWYRAGLYVNDGKGNFTKSGLSIPAASDFCDLNEDGAVDIIAALPGKGIKVYLNDKKGQFTEKCFVNKNDLMLGYFGFGDIDNDGDKDVIYSNGTEDEQLPSGVLLNDGNGNLTDSGQKLMRAAWGFIGIGDLNNDGWKDIVITDRNNPSRVYLNTGSGKFIDAGITLGDGGMWNNCIIKDIDNDGDKDIFITRVFRGSSSLWFNKLKESDLR